MALGPEAQKELNEALKIFREDHVVKNLAEIKRHLKIGMEEPVKDKEETPKDPGEGDPPPPSDDKSPKEQPKTKHNWWGEL